MSGEFLTVTKPTPQAEKRQAKARKIKPGKQGNPEIKPGEPMPLAIRAKLAASRKTHYAKSLAEMVRAIGAEVVDEASGMTRLDLLVRRIYSDAIAGKTAAAEVILERGWGKVPTPVELDISGEVHQLVQSTGITADEINNDPVLKSLLETSGVVVEGQFRMIEAPVESGENGRKPNPIDAGQDQTGTDST